MTERAEGDDWAARAVAQLESVVELVRGRSVRPVLFAARALAAAIVAGTLAIGVAVAFTVGVVRLLDADAFAGRVWATDFVLAGIFATLGGFLLWASRRTGRGDGG
ncbi:MAG TPA: hypothetical protein VKV23_09980 [Acidimicrobiales bacterium]|nr:hypothetical protein [Acidimicrobiales bacterium]